ncbi:MAG: lamin tail domain-containing protein [Streptomyces sp.]|nr:lamin tail domain-containing protein [Streptomyces sp.]
MLSAGAIVTAAALPASAADHDRRADHSRHAEHGRSDDRGRTDDRSRTDNRGRSGDRRRGDDRGRGEDRSRGGDRGQDHRQRPQQRPDVVLGSVHHADRGARSDRELNDEWITVANAGRGPAYLRGWTLTDSDHNVYRFPAVTLRAHESLRVHTGAGRDTARDLYQDRRTAVWERSRDTATLRDARGQVVDTESWGRGRP